MKVFWGFHDLRWEELEVNTLTKKNHVHVPFVPSQETHKPSPKMWQFGQLVWFLSFERRTGYLVVIPEAPIVLEMPWWYPESQRHTSLWLFLATIISQKNRSRKRWFLTARSIQFSLTTKILPRVLKDSICEASKIVVVVVLDSDSPIGASIPTG